MNDKRLNNIAIAVVSAIAGYAVVSVIANGKVLPAQGSGFPGGIEGAKAQMRTVLEEYRNNNWDSNLIPKHHLLLTDEAAVPNNDPNVRYRNSFSFGKFPTSDEVAFVTTFYVNERLEVVRGIEGRLSRSGVYLVAFRDGRIEEVPSGDFRILWVRYQTHTLGLQVYPGMRDYSRSLRLTDPQPALEDMDPLPSHISPEYAMKI